MATTAQLAKRAESAMKSVHKDVDAWCKKRGLKLWSVERAQWYEGSRNTGWTIVVENSASVHRCSHGTGKTIAAARRDLLRKLEAGK